MGRLVSNSRLARSVYRAVVLRIDKVSMVPVV